MDVSRWLAELVPSPAARKPLGVESFLKELLPAIVLYYATAFLVVTRGTLKIRIALLPITLWTAFRAGAGLDVIAGIDERFAHWNQGLSLAMTTLSMRVIIWTCQLEHYVRQSHNGEATPNGKMHGHRAWDALELCFNLRGCGWNWSDGLYVPKETRPTSRSGFAITTALYFLIGLILFDIAHISVQSLDPNFSLPAGGSIYDMSLPPIPRYLRSSLICFLGGLVFWGAIEVFYLLGTLIGVVVLQQHPSQWPPLFENPMLSSSLSEYWSKRWHQLFRQCFVFLGFKPMSFIAGRAGGVLGAFFVSGILHDLGLRGMGRGGEPSSIYTSFLMMGVGVVMENAWKHMTGYKVGGVIGRAWAIAWLVGWSHLVMDVYCRKGVVAGKFFPDGYRPSLALLHFARRFLKL